MEEQIEMQDGASKQSRFPTSLPLSESTLC